MPAERIRIRGTVQGVGFRPLVAQLARAAGLDGEVKNDGAGVTILLGADRPTADAFLERLFSSLPRLAKIERVERTTLTGAPALSPGFYIQESEGGAVETNVSADAAPCAHCLAELRSPYDRRFRYPFINCVECGPRFTIAKQVPWDRAHTTMATYPLCAACRGEYEDDGDRRFHAEPVACHTCGPKVWLERSDGRPFSYERYSALDLADAVGGLLLAGEIVALKGVGGYQLLCDATQEEVVTKLRARKHREAKPLALLARDLDVVRRWAVVSPEEEEALKSSAAPIVLLPRGERAVAAAIAPGMASLGFMLPASPLHHLIMRRLDRPVVCTSGNRSDEPPALRDVDARERLGGIADWICGHDREIAHRADDSVVRKAAGKVRVLRRARGYVPAPIALPPGFERGPSVLALGGHFKATVCLAARGQAVLSQHLGDLDDLSAFEDWGRAGALLEEIFQHRAEHLVVDAHPEYRSTIRGRALAAERNLTCTSVLHHHAHLASCMAENGHPLEGPPVLGVTFDGIGYGEGGELWGGEFLLGDYRRIERVGTIKPVPLLGGDAAAKEPWRNLYAHLLAEHSWAELTMNFKELELYQRLSQKPRDLLEQIRERRELSPLSSSAGRWFDAVAAAVGLCFDRVAFEGQAAMALEALATEAELAQAQAEEIYPVGIPKLRGSGLPYLEPNETWMAILGDLHAGERPAKIAARFHVALAKGIVAMVQKLERGGAAFSAVALSGGVFQNAALLGLTQAGLLRAGYRVLLHERVPSNDGGIALGQAAIAMAQQISGEGR